MNKNNHTTIQNFIDNPSNISESLIEILTQEDISQENFFYKEDNNYNFWHFLFLSIPHLEKFNEELRQQKIKYMEKLSDKRFPKRLGGVVFKNIRFDISKDKDIFDIIKNTSPYLFNIEQNYFIYSIISDDMKEQSGLDKNNNFNAYVIDYWASVLQLEDKIEIDNFYERQRGIDFKDIVVFNDFTSDFISTYEKIDSAGRNIIYFFAKFTDFLNSHKVTQEHRELIAHQLHEKMDCRDDIIFSVSDFCSVSYNPDKMYQSYLYLGYVYARIQYISTYVQNNKIIVERDKLSELIQGEKQQIKISKI